MSSLNRSYLNDAGLAMPPEIRAMALERQRRAQDQECMCAHCAPDGTNASMEECIDDDCDECGAARSRSRFAFPQKAIAHVARRAAQLRKTAVVPVVSELSTEQQEELRARTRAVLAL